MEKELAKLIRKGYDEFGLKEYKYTFLTKIDSGFRACPLGSALVAKVGLEKALTLLTFDNPKVFSILAEHLGLSENFVIRISKLHSSSRQTADSIIEGLENGTIIQ